MRGRRAFANVIMEPSIFFLAPPVVRRVQHVTSCLATVKFSLFFFMYCYGLGSLIFFFCWGSWFRFGVLYDGDGCVCLVCLLAALGGSEVLVGDVFLADRVEGC